jgi:myb proto-oncogene protein
MVDFPQKTKTSFRNPKHFFTTSEDILLLEIMQNQSFISWEDVAEKIPERSQKQCRDRWLNYLAPWIKKEDWTKEEDDIIIQNVQQNGTKWSKLTKLIPGRTDNGIKNRWYPHLSKMENQNEYVKPKIDFWTELEWAYSPIMKNESSNLEKFFQLF